MPRPKQANIFRFCGVLCVLLLDSVESELSLHPSRYDVRIQGGKSETAIPLTTRGGGTFLTAEKEKKLDPLEVLYNVIGKSFTAASFVYVGILMIWGPYFSSQLQALTVIRIAGFPRFQTAMIHFQENLRRANRVKIRNAISLVRARDTVYSLGQRAEEARDILAITKAAKADGIVTAEEAEEIQFLQRQQLKKIRRDVQRIKHGSNAMARLWDTLDLDDLWEMMEDFVFMFCAVLATGNSNSIVSTAFAKYCYILSLGGLFRQVTTRFQNPLAKAWLRILPFLPANSYDEEMEKDLREIARACSAVGSYVLATCVVGFQLPWSIVINDSLMVSYIFLKIVERITCNTDFFENWRGGIWMLAVSTLAFYNYFLAFPPPEWISGMFWIENMVSGVVKAVHTTIQTH